MPIHQLWACPTLWVVNVQLWGCNLRVINPLAHNRVSIIDWHPLNFLLIQTSVLITRPNSRVTILSKIDFRAKFKILPVKFSQLLYLSKTLPYTRTTTRRSRIKLQRLNRIWLISNINKPFKLHSSSCRISTFDQFISSLFKLTNSISNH